MELDQLAERRCRDRGALPAFLGYRGYPASACISVNESVVHGLPGERVLQSGDIVSLDFACSWEGMHADAAVTVSVGEVAPEARRLIAVTREALLAGIAVAQAGYLVGEIGRAVQAHVDAD